MWNMYAGMRIEDVIFFNQVIDQIYVNFLKYLKKKIDFVLKRSLGHSIVTVLSILT